MGIVFVVISEMLKEAQNDTNMTQEQLAEKVGTKKSHISGPENGKCDIQRFTGFLNMGFEKK